jgi:hypothetical protein
MVFSIGTFHDLGMMQSGIENWMAPAWVNECNRDLSTVRIHAVSELAHARLGSSRLSGKEGALRTDGTGSTFRFSAFAEVLAVPFQ